jgi:hypothetical protein
VIADVVEPNLTDAVAEYTPQYGEGDWSLRFPKLDVQQTREVLSKFAKNMLK